MKRPSKAPEIIRLYATGMKATELAAQVGVSTNYIYKVLRINKINCRRIKTFKIAALDREDRRWLTVEAKRIGSTPAEVARSLLIDAIYESRHENDPDT